MVCAFMPIIPISVHVCYNLKEVGGFCFNKYSFAKYTESTPLLKMGHAFPRSFAYGLKGGSVTTGHFWPSCSCSSGEHNTELLWGQSVPVFTQQPSFPAPDNSVILASSTFKSQLSAKLSRTECFLCSDSLMGNPAIWLLLWGKCKNLQLVGNISLRTENKRAFALLQRFHTIGFSSLRCLSRNSQNFKISRNERFATTQPGWLSRSCQGRRKLLEEQTMGNVCKRFCNSPTRLSSVRARALSSLKDVSRWSQAHPFCQLLSWDTS